MDPLPLPLLGWIFTLVSAVALAAGALILIMLYRSGDLMRRYAEQSIWNDMTLLTIWCAGLLGGIGVLLEQSWSRPLLELFCWVLGALVILSGATRIYVLYRSAHTDAPFNWVGAVSGFLAVAIPVLVLCGATIYTLRSEVARRALGGY